MGAMTTGGAIGAGMTGGPIIGNTIRSAGMTGAGTTDDTIPDAMTTTTTTTATAGAITMPPGMAGITTAGRIGTGGTRAGTERDPSLPLNVRSAEGETHV